MDKRAELLKSAKHLFSTLGYKNTNVAKITEMAGMATGTFYNYFESKDNIFMEIYIEENKKLKLKNAEKVNIDDSPMTVMTTLMQLNEQGMHENPILCHWYDKDTFSKIEESFRKSKGLDELDFFYEDFLGAIKHWQEKGEMRADIEPKMIMALFNALIHTDLHKDEIGEEYFPDLMNYLAEFIMNGLLTKKI